MANKLWLILISGKTDLTELWLGILQLGWGLYIVSPHWNPFELPVYAAFITLAPIWVWGSISIFVGLLTILAILCTHCLSISYSLRRIALFANASVWACVAMAFWLAPAVNSGQISYMLLAVLSMWLFIRVRFRGNDSL